MTSGSVHTLHQALSNHRTARALKLNKAEFRGQDLTGLRADSLNLEDVDLREVILKNARWRSCTLRDARLDRADFTEAVLRMCDLDAVRAEAAVFVRTRLENSTARGARFDGADFSEAVLTDTDFSRASLRGARLENAEASGANFRGADLRDAVLRHADLTDADLRGADLTGADLEGADLHGADLRGVQGEHPALQPADGSWSTMAHDMPKEVRDLSKTVAPIVGEVLRTAGQSGALDAATAERLAREASRLAGHAPDLAPSAEAMNAVARVVDRLGADVFPRLIDALQRPNDGDPPADVQDFLLKLRDELALGDTATMDDVLEQLRASTAPEN